jgi:peptidoglycan-associated lipoprotein
MLAMYEPPPVAAPPPAPVAAAAPAGETVIRVSPDIIKDCNIDDSKMGEDPLFAFDSSALSRADQHLLKEVAACAVDGPLTGHSLKLVGRADPRGTEAYNLHLGDRRANSVARYLERNGVSPVRVDETSRGALDATGHDEAGWKQDRRVDVDLASI